MLCTRSRICRFLQQIVRVGLAEAVQKKQEMKPYQKLLYSQREVYSGLPSQRYFTEKSIYIVFKYIRDILSYSQGKGFHRTSIFMVYSAITAQILQQGVQFIFDRILRIYKVTKEVNYSQEMLLEKQILTKFVHIVMRVQMKTNKLIRMVAANFITNIMKESIENEQKQKYIRDKQSEVKILTKEDYYNSLLYLVEIGYINDRILRDFFAKAREIQTQPKLSLSNQTKSQKLGFIEQAIPCLNLIYKLFQNQEYLSTYQNQLKNLKVLYQQVLDNYVSCLSEPQMIYELMNSDVRIFAEHLVVRFLPKTDLLPIKKAYITLFKTVFDVQKNSCNLFSIVNVRSIFETVLMFYTYEDHKMVWQLLEKFEYSLHFNVVSTLEPFYVCAKFYYKSNFIAGIMYGLINEKISRNSAEQNSFFIDKNNTKLLHYQVYLNLLEEKKDYSQFSIDKVNFDLDKLIIDKVQELPPLIGGNTKKGQTDRTEQEQKNFNMEIDGRGQYSISDNTFNEKQIFDFDIPIQFAFFQLLRTTPTQDNAHIIQYLKQESEQMEQTEIEDQKSQDENINDEKEQVLKDSSLQWFLDDEGQQFNKNPGRKYTEKSSSFFKQIKKDKEKFIEKSAIRTSRDIFKSSIKTVVNQLTSQQRQEITKQFLTLLNNLSKNIVDDSVPILFSKKIQSYLNLQKLLNGHQKLINKSFLQANIYCVYNGKVKGNHYLVERQESNLNRQIPFSYYDNVFAQSIFLLNSLNIAYQGNEIFQFHTQILKEVIDNIFSDEWLEFYLQNPAYPELIQNISTVLKHKFGCLNSKFQKWLEEIIKEFNLQLKAATNRQPGPLNPIYMKNLEVIKQRRLLIPQYKSVYAQENILHYVSQHRYITISRLLADEKSQFKKLLQEHKVFWHCQLDYFNYPFMADVRLVMHGKTFFVFLQVSKQNPFLENLLHSRLESMIYFKGVKNNEVVVLTDKNEMIQFAKKCAAA